MNLGDLYRLAMQSGMTVGEDGGLEGDLSSTYLLSKRLDEFKKEQENDLLKNDDWM